MKRVYLRPETIKVRYDIETFIAASPTTEWHMKPDGNESDENSNIGDGEGHDPNADAKGWSGIDLWSDDMG